MASSLSFRPDMLPVLSPFVDRTGPPNPLLNRTQFPGFSDHRPFIRGSLSVAKFGFKPEFLPDPGASDGVIRELFTRAESFLYTIGDASVSSSDAITTTTSTTKLYNGWLLGIADSMETILKVLKDGLLSLHIPYAYGFAIILLTILFKAATFPSTRKQVESAMAMRSLQPQIKAIQQRYTGDQLKEQEARRRRQREEARRKAQQAAAAKADQLTNEGLEIEGSIVDKENGAGTGLSIEKKEKYQSVAGRGSSYIGVVNGNLSCRDLKEDLKKASSFSKSSESLEDVEKETVEVYTTTATTEQRF